MTSCTKLGCVFGTRILWRSVTFRKLRELSTGPLSHAVSEGYLYLHCTCLLPVSPIGARALFALSLPNWDSFELLLTQRNKHAMYELGKRRAQ